MLRKRASGANLGPKGIRWLRYTDAFQATDVTMATDPLSDFDHEILRFLEAAGASPDSVQLSTPPERAFGERATNVAFRLAPERREAPRQIAAAIAAQFDRNGYTFLKSVEPAGTGFINFRLDYAAFIPHTISAIAQHPDTFGRRENSSPQRIVVEHTSVNPNKEWHIGHARNAILGDVLMRLLRLAGHAVDVQNYIDDTGLQAAQAIYGLQTFPEQPQADEKFDHFAGRAYVKIAAELGLERELQADRDQLPEGEERKNADIRLTNINRLQNGVLATMHALESGEYRGLIERILDAQLLTAYRLGAFYNLLNWESHLVQSHLFEEAMRRLEHSPSVYTSTEGRYQGAVVIETGNAQEGQEPKREVLIRSNGLPTYVAKDIAYSIWKFGLLPDRLRYVDYVTQPNGVMLRSTALEGDVAGGGPPDRVINVIAVHQTQAQDAVREGLRAGGFDAASAHLVHLDYGMVSTAAGRISGRKGTSVSADGVIDEVVRVALERVTEKRSQDLDDEQMEAIAEAVGVGALRYFMVQYNPLRDIVFDVANVVSYDGNTGLYVQYALVRMFAILRRASAEHGIEDAKIAAGDAGLLEHEQERRLIFHLASYPEAVATAARTLAVNLIAEYAFDLATIFNQFYRDCGVLNAESELRNARLLLVRTVRDVLVNACGVLGVPVIERL